MIKSTVKGSYTVEAALLMPCILLFIIGLLYLGFYMHDKVKILAIIDQTEAKARSFLRCETDLDTGVMNYEIYNRRGIFYYINNNLTDKEEAIFNYLDNKLSRGLFVAKVKNLDITVSQSKIDIRVDVNMEFPFIQVRRLFSNSGLQIQIENACQIQNQMEFIRIWDVFADSINKSEAADGALIKIHNLLEKVR